MLAGYELSVPFAVVLKPLMEEAKTICAKCLHKSAVDNLDMDKDETWLKFPSQQNGLYLFTFNLSEQDLQSEW